MSNRDPTDSEPDETPVSSSCDSKKKPKGYGRDVNIVPEYEKQRLSRIAENRKRMEALGLAKLASSFMDSAKNSRKIDKKGKRKMGEDNDAADEDYEPSEDSSSGEDGNEIDEDFGSEEVSESRGMKGKNKGTKAKRKTSVDKSNNLDDEGDDNALRQAIELSLQDSGAVDNVRRKNVKTQEVTGGMKRKGSFTRRMQMNEDELIMNFYCFDESWKGSISVSDLKRVAAAHDFTWSDNELRDMIDSFDSDGDGKLTLDDFRRIAGRCNMIKEPLTS